jgi:CrcB protein
METLLVFLGAGIGGVARFALGGWIQHMTGADFPTGTLVINVTGSFVLALLYALLQGIPAADPWRLLLGIGFCGGYTTFSAFSYEALRLLQDGEGGRAVAYVVGSTVLSLAGAWMGFTFGAAALRQG